LRGMQPADVHPDVAAEIVVGAEVLTLLCPRHRVGLDAERAREPLRLACEAVIGPWRGCAGEPAGQLEVAVDPFVGAEPVQVFASELGLGLDGAGAGFAEAPDQLGGTRPDVAAGDAAVAARRALPGTLPVENLHGPSGAGEGDRRTQPGIAGADDDDVG